MNKTEYLQALRQALDGLPATVIQETVWEYEASFADAMASGKSEEEAAASLPKPELVAARKKANNRYQVLKHHFTVGNIASWLVALIGLMVFNLFMFIPAVVYFSLLCSSYVLALSLYVAGIGVTAASLSGVDHFSMDVPYQNYHAVRHGHHKVTSTLQHENMRVEITESGIFIDGEKANNDSKVAQDAGVITIDSTSSVAGSVPAATAEPGKQELHVEVGNHFYGSKALLGIGMIIASVLLLMLSMFMTKYTFIGFRHYLRWNLLQLHLVRPA
ncbi:DUF1700 domain-containing protein [Undibacterium sp. Ji50W]|uniref:DUF1700 domain-containing protein n=1 Tax=Undibacterium sp. Ji50W TaxID=3413041 RepID=UPI003BF457A3